MPIAASRISIRDYGCGIPAEALPRIFDPYFTTKPAGSGLGLATAYAIALCEEATLSGKGFDTALLDLTVRGGMGGVEAAARLREIDPSITSSLTPSAPFARDSATPQHLPRSAEPLGSCA